MQSIAGRKACWLGLGRNRSCHIPCNALVLGARKKLLDLSGYEPGYFHEFDVSADGQRFLLIRAEPGSRRTHLDLVLNWLEELKQRVPVK